MQQSPNSGDNLQVSMDRGLAWKLQIALLILLLAPCRVNAFERYARIKKYDPYFVKYSKRFFGPAFDWRNFKAQAIAESGLRPDARSKVGAGGLMQIMPATFKEISKKCPYIKGSRFHPRWNIAAGIYYDRQLWKTWRARRPFEDRLAFMFGSFNAGKMNVIKAQKLAHKKGLNPNLWRSVKSTLPRVTGRRSRETIAYVDKINRIKGVLR